jgi:signal transduction histidine kinase
MADRLAAAGGTLRVHSAPGLGTTISGRLPVSELAATER